MKEHDIRRRAFPVAHSIPAGQIMADLAELTVLKDHDSEVALVGAENRKAGTAHQDADKIDNLQSRSAEGG